MKKKYFIFYNLLNKPNIHNNYTLRRITKHISIKNKMYYIF